MVSPEVESACDAAGAALPGVAAASADAPPGARAVGAEPEPDPDPPDEPAAAAAVEPFPCTTAPLSPGFPTLTSTFTFFGLSWLALADAFAFPV